MKSVSSDLRSTKNIFSYRKFWAQRFGTSPFLPMTRAEMDTLGWDACDIILVTGDAYVDHPSFGMALIGRLLEAQGFRVGIISQPDWQSKDAFKALGKPTLFYGVTSGNMDSLVNRYTAERKTRSEDAYTPNGEVNRRPDRAVIVYSQRCREAYPGVPIVIGSIEASLRRIAHYDYWSDKVRRSILPDSKADILLFGNAERALVALAHRLAAGEAIESIRDLRGSAFMVPRGWQPGEDWQAIDSSEIDRPGQVGQAENPYLSPTCKTQETSTHAETKVVHLERIRHRRAHSFIRLPAYEIVKDNPVLYAHASRTLHLESNPGNARALVQAHADRDVWLNPPPLPLTTEEFDGVYALPYQRKPHPAYAQAKIAAFEMIQNSITILRGCFGGCTFCSITEHEGRIIQNRSPESILNEINEVRDKSPGFTGTISDLGGATANMYRMGCKSEEILNACRRLSCVFPGICPNLNTDHTPLIALYRQARQTKGVKKILIGSGLRYDLAVRSPEYVKELVSHHVGGYLKIAPEHTEDTPLQHMMKPGISAYESFRLLFERFSKEAGKEQYLIPYFIAAHPGTSDEDMLNVALWLKKNKFRPDQVQTFLPTPMALATTMYHTQENPLKKIRDNAPKIEVAKGAYRRRLHKAFLRYHAPENWPLLREALQKMGRAELIGNSKQHLVPFASSWGVKRERVEPANKRRPIARK